MGGAFFGTWLVKNYWNTTYNSIISSDQDPNVSVETKQNLCFIATLLTFALGIALWPITCCPAILDIAFDLEKEE